MCPCCIRKSILPSVQHILFRKLWMTLHDSFVNNYIHNTHSLNTFILLHLTGKCNTNMVLHLQTHVYNKTAKSVSKAASDKTLLLVCMEILSEVTTR